MTVLNISLPKKITALIILGGVIIAMIALIVLPLYFLHRYYDRQIEQQETLLARYTQLTAKAETIPQTIEALKARDTAKYYLKNTADNLAAAEVQDIVRAAILSRSGKIVSTQNLPSGETEGIPKIGVNVQFTGTLDAVQQVLSSLESHVPYLVIENLLIRPQNVTRDYHPTPGIEPECLVSMEVIGFVLKAPDTSDTTETTNTGGRES
ncbi:MAG: type II secretion system protein M [Burkholderiales bacterium]|jgi:hypothetical protein|nr:type II secretion system protein M [Burkholderiales bacterium]